MGGNPPVNMHVSPQDEQGGSGSVSSAVQFRAFFQVHGGAVHQLKNAAAVQADSSPDIHVTPGIR